MATSSENSSNLATSSSERNRIFFNGKIIIDDLGYGAVLPNKLLSQEFVAGNLSGLVLGEFVERSQDSERNVFIFRGHAMGDLALSVLAYQRSRKIIHNVSNAPFILL